MEVFQVSGMGCGSCVAKITKALKDQDPQAKVEVDLTSGKVTVDSKESRSAVCELITDLGFEVAPES